MRLEFGNEASERERKIMERRKRYRRVGLETFFFIQSCFVQEHEVQRAVEAEVQAAELQLQAEMQRQASERYQTDVYQTKYLNDGMRRRRVIKMTQLTQVTLHENSETSYANKSKLKSA